jgi:hypothetical protein
MSIVVDLSRQTNTKAACAAFNIPRATYYRQTANLTVAKPRVRLASPPLALTLTEEQQVLDALHLISTILIHSRSHWSFSAKVVTSE